MNTWLIIALVLYSLGITAVLLVEWHKERPSKQFIRSIEKPVRSMNTMTNGEALRRMDDKRLAEQLVIRVDGLEPCTVFLSAPTGRMFISRDKAVQVTLEWLQQEEQADENE